MAYSSSGRNIYPQYHSEAANGIHFPLARPFCISKLGNPVVRHIIQQQCTLTTKDLTPRIRHVTQFSTPGTTFSNQINPQEMLGYFTGNQSLGAWTEPIREFLSFFISHSIKKSSCCGDLTEVDTILPR